MGINTNPIRGSTKTSGVLNGPRLMHLIASELLEHANSQFAKPRSPAHRSLFLSDSHDTILTTLRQFGKNLDLQQNAEKSATAPLAIGVFLPLPNVDDFHLFVGKSLIPGKIDSVENGFFSANLGVSFDKPSGQNKEDIRLEAWFLPKEVAQKSPLNVSLLAFFADETTYRLRQTVLYEQPWLSREQLDRCRILNLCLTELFEQNSWLTLYKPEFFLKEDKTPTPATTPNTVPGYVHAYLLPSIMELVALSFQITRHQKTFSSPLGFNYDTSNEFQACFAELLRVYDLESNSRHEMAKTGRRGRIRRTWTPPDNQHPAFEVLTLIDSAFHERHLDSFMFDELIHINILSLREKEDTDMSRLCWALFNKPVSAIHLACNLKTSAKRTRRGVVVKIEKGPSSFKPLTLKKMFSFGELTKSSPVAESKVLTEETLFPIALFESQKDAQQAIESTELMQGAKGELYALPVACVEPQAAANYLLPLSSHMEVIMAHYTQGLMPSKTP